MTPGGVWDSDTMEIMALVSREGKQVGSVPGRYSGSRSYFLFDCDIQEPGVYEIVVYAYDPANGNTGLDKVYFQVSFASGKSDISFAPKRAKKENLPE